MFSKYKKDEGNPNAPALTSISGGQDKPTTRPVTTQVPAEPKRRNVSKMPGQVAAADIDRFKAFFHGMLDEGVYLAPSAFEAGFVSSAHGDDEISQTLDAARKVLMSLRAA